MKHVIIGTAGHIDHGKTTLIKALTGRETDRLKEEQKRGISIELGFTYFDLPSGKRAGIIDVPGHEKFIKNMLAGAVGIDIVLLVIAADEGVMPQTKEHLAILDLLGIKKGFVVLTKIDLVDKEWQELVIEDVNETIKGSFLEGCEIISVSSTERLGINKVIQKVDELADEVEKKDLNDMPRLPVDRVFTISGFGTIVTGTLLSGVFKVGEEVQIFPGNKIARIRSLQIHEKDTLVAYAGQRVAINLAGLKKTDIQRGDVVAPVKSMEKTMMIDVKLKTLKDVFKGIKNRSRLRLHIGTKEVLCRAVLLDKEELLPGESCYAQLRLEESIVAKRNDKFIIRFYSPTITIGGGRILESNPIKNKRYDKKVLEELKIKEKGVSIEIVEKIIKDNSSKFLTINQICVLTATSKFKVEKEINKLSEQDKIIIFKLSKDIHVIHVDYFNLLAQKITNELKEYHKKQPLKSGISKEELKSKYLKNVKTKLSNHFINLMEQKGIISQHNENISIKDFKIQYSQEQKNIRNDIQKTYKENKFLILKKQDIIKKTNYNKNEVEKVFKALVDSGELLKLKDDFYISKNLYLESIQIVKDYIKNNKFITVGKCRDILNTNRKSSIFLLEKFDEEKITCRVGDKRELIE